MATNLSRGEKEIIDSLEDRSHIPATFFTEPRIINQQEVEEKGAKPIYDDVLFLRLFKELNNIHVKKPKEQDFRRYAKEYEAFKEGREQRAIGTPLNMLGSLTDAQIENFKVQNVYTIERLAEVGETILVNLGVGARQAQQKAIEYLEGKSSAELELKEANKELDALKKEIERLKKGKKNEPVNNGAKRSG